MVFKPILRRWCSRRNKWIWKTSWNRNRIHPSLVCRILNRKPKLLLCKPASRWQTLGITILQLWRLSNCISKNRSRWAAIIRLIATRRISLSKLCKLPLIITIVGSRRLISSRGKLWMLHSTRIRKARYLKPTKLVRFSLRHRRISNKIQMNWREFLNRANLTAREMLLHLSRAFCSRTMRGNN